MTTTLPDAEIALAALTPEDRARLTDALAETGLASALEGLYWLPVPAGLLSETQTEHLAECGPYALALNLDDNGRLSLETLVRAQNRLHCRCIAPASEAVLEDALLKTLSLLAELDIHPLPEICQA